MAACGIMTLVSITICCGDKVHPEAKEAQSSSPSPEPVVIWYHNVHRDPPVALETAISSGLITHVIVKCIHRNDFDYKKHPPTLAALKLAKNSDVTLIWSRPLWIMYDVANSRPDDLFDPAYYINEINMIRDEARAMGAQEVALDTEPYADSPLKKYLKGKVSLTNQQIATLKSVVDQVIKTVGKVDYIYPAGSNQKHHPHNYISQLGASRIAEYTYYDNQKRLDKMRFAYEIFGAYVHTTKKNSKYPHLQYFLVPEIFENKAALWSVKEGLFVYPMERHALAVAKEMVKFAQTPPAVIYRPLPHLVHQGGAPTQPAILTNTIATFDRIVSP